jgi:transcriptional regulator with XRE-family HTH domain
MLLTRLKYWREQRGYSLRELADKSKVPYSAISLLENLKREPQGRTVRKLAAALDVEVVDLHQPDPVVLEPKYTPAQPANDNRIITPAKPVRTSKAAKKQPANYCWVVDFEGDAFGPFVLADAERLQGKLGGWHKARVYKAGSKAEAREMHRQFLIKVARGHDAW